MSTVDGKVIFNSKKIEKKSLALFIFLAVLTAAFRLWHLSELYSPFLFDDEAGYWSHAANLAGMSWTEVERSWYSYGYSLFLVPFFWITQDIVILYRIAIILNGIFGVVSFGLAVLVLRELDVECDDKTKILVSFAAVNYSSYLFQANIAWAESCVYMWFWLVLWLGIRFVKKPTYLYTIFLTWSVSYLYIIHNRTLIVLIAYVIMLCCMYICKKFDWKILASTFCLLMVFYGVDQLLRKTLNTLMWGKDAKVEFGLISSKLIFFILSIFFVLFILWGVRCIAKTNNWAKGILVISILLSCIILIGIIRQYFANITKGSEISFIGNDINAHIGKLKLLFSLGGIWTLLKSLCGKIWYIISATFLFALWGMFYIIKKIINLAQEKGNLVFFWLFLLLSILGTVALSTFAMLPNRDGDLVSVRLDLLFYGRYSDMVCGLLIAFGFVYAVQIASKKRKMLIFLGPLCIFIGCSAFINWQIDDINNYYLVQNCVPGIYFGGDFDIKKISVIVIIVFTVVYAVALYINKLKYLQTWGVGFICIFLVSIFLNGYENVYHSYVPAHQALYIVYEPIVQVLKDNNQYITYMQRDDGVKNSHFLRQHLRTSLVKNRIVYEIPKDEDNYFLIIGKEKLKELLSKGIDCYYVLETGIDDMEYVCGVGEVLKKELKLQGYECNNMGKPGGVYSKIDIMSERVGTITGTKTGAYIRSDGTSGVVMFGPYISLQADKYYVKIPIEILEQRRSSLGICTIYSNSENIVLLSRTPIENYLIEEKGNRYLKIPFELDQDLDNLEIVIESSEGSVFNLYSYGIYYSE